MSWVIADPYPVVSEVGLEPVVGLPFDQVDELVFSFNRCDPQPPGYAYRFPRAIEYKPWAECRSLIQGIDFSPWPVDGAVSEPLYGATIQGISYYNQGLWHHVNGSVACWCGDPLTPRGFRMIQLGFQRSLYQHAFESAPLGWGIPDKPRPHLGFRLVRGPLPRGSG